MAMSSPIAVRAVGLRAALVVLGALVSACGGGGSAGSGPGISWQEDGVPIAALGIKPAFLSSGGRDSLEIIGLGTSAHVGVTVVVAAPTPLSPQTFVCNQTTSGQSVIVTYTDADGGLDLATQSCTVVLTQVGVPGGAPAIGTFEAVFTLSAGGTKTISNGRFNLPLKL
jgi:hypothetical protein